jgi:diguanylate cyclase (GGDEF)-like protein
VSLFLKIDINIVAFLVLAIILMTSARRLDMRDGMNRAYFRVAIIVLIQLIIETTTCIINHIDRDWLIPVFYLLHICLFIMGSILALNGYLLVRYFVFPNTELLSWKKVLLGIPILLNTILVGLTPFFHLVFYVDSENNYYRGKFFGASIAMIYLYVFLMILMIFANRRKLGNNEFIPLLTLSIFPVIGGIIQTVIYGSLLMWSTTAFALIIMHSYLQQRMVQLDYLTGVWSRGSFDFYIKNRMKQRSNVKLGIVYCDMDGLKEINDKYGHKEGDYVIKTMTQIIRKTIRKTDIIVRMGGDEFIIVLECNTKEILSKILEKLELAFHQYNETSNRNYKISCSFGADILNQDSQSIEQFLHHVDSLMYTNKKIKKERMSRAEA